MRIALLVLLGTLPLAACTSDADAPPPGYRWELGYSTDEHDVYVPVPIEGGTVERAPQGVRRAAPPARPAAVETPRAQPRPVPCPVPPPPPPPPPPPSPRG